MDYDARNTQYNESPPDGIHCKVCLKDDEWKKCFEIVEIITVVVFSIEYALRIYSVVEENEGKTYRGISGRLRWIVTDPYSYVDIATILPFYIDLCIPGDLASSQFLRILRLFRMMRVEGRYLQSFDMFGKTERVEISSISSTFEKIYEVSQGKSKI